MPLAVSRLCPDQQLVLALLGVGLEVVLLQHGNALLLVLLLLPPARLLLVVRGPPAVTESVKILQVCQGNNKTELEKMTFIGRSYDYIKDNAKSGE